jgi:hypothetical protein
MTNSDKGHMVAESDNIGEILTALSQPAIA